MSRRQIQGLPDLHVEMDVAVGAYGWSDLDLGRDFRARPPKAQTGSRSASPPAGKSTFAETRPWRYASKWSRASTRNRVVGGWRVAGRKPEVGAARRAFSRHGQFPRRRRPRPGGRRRRRSRYRSRRGREAAPLTPVRRPRCRALRPPQNADRPVRDRCHGGLPSGVPWPWLTGR